jgi:hypothetical protein
MRIDCYWKDKGTGSTERATINFPVLPRVGDTISIDDIERQVHSVVFEVERRTLLDPRDPPFTLKATFVNLR